MSNRDLGEEIRRELLRDQQSRRRAREEREELSLHERRAILLVTVAVAIFALIHSIG